MAIPAAMNTRPVLAPSPIGATVAAAALSILVTIGLLMAVAGLFLHDGTPLQNVVVARSR